MIVPVRVARSATLQMRVTPGVKRASEEVLRRLGLTMTEAMELFLRRMIIDQRLPFDVVALDNATYTNFVLDWEEHLAVMTERNQAVKITRNTSTRRTGPRKRIF